MYSILCALLLIIILLIIYSYLKPRTRHVRIHDVNTTAKDDIDLSNYNDLDPSYLSSRERIGAASAIAKRPAAINKFDINDDSIHENTNNMSVNRDCTINTPDQIINYLYTDTMGIARKYPITDDCEYNNIIGYSYKTPCVY